MIYKNAISWFEIPATRCALGLGEEQAGQGMER